MRAPIAAESAAGRLGGWSDSALLRRVGRGLPAVIGCGGSGSATSRPVVQSSGLKGKGRQATPGHRPDGAGLPAGGIDIWLGVCKCGRV